MEYCPDCNRQLSYGETMIGMCRECGCDLDEDDSEDYYERWEEQRAEELAERAASCKCGAWQFAKDGAVVHVSDCCCGAE